MDIPGAGHFKGMFDLRDGVGEYLGHVNLRGKRVLEVGTADGFLCFEMERQGASVVAYDLSAENEWDIVPFARMDYQNIMTERKTVIDQINNAYWFAHKAHNSQAKVVYGSVYTIPEAIGMVDVTTFGCVLLHLRDPFFALQNALRLTRDTVIVTETVPPSLYERILTRVLTPAPLRWAYPYLGSLLDRVRRPRMAFMPEYARCKYYGTWWGLTPGIIKQFIGVLGFERTSVHYHFQIYEGYRVLLYTVVGHRTAGSGKPTAMCKGELVP
jgi:SAM-dependent methyltransferase